jgi:hypothetical protein
MVGFERVGGTMTEGKKRVIGAVAYLVGDLLMRSTTTGLLIAATSSVTPNLMSAGGIVQNATDGVVTEVVIQPIDYCAEYIVGCASNSDVADNYMQMTLTDENTVNNTGTDDVTNPAVIQVGVVGAAADKKIIVQFVRAIS